MTHPEGKSSDISAHEVYGDEFFKETTKYNPHSPYSASKAVSDHFVRAYPHSLPEDTPKLTWQLVIKREFQEH